MRVDHSFDAESDSEMSIVPGELVNVLEEVDAGWFIGEIVGDEHRTGMFPSTYCTIVEPSPTRRTAPKPPSPTKSEGDAFGDLDDQLASLSVRRGTAPPRPTVSRSKTAVVQASATAAAKKKPPPPPPTSRGTKSTSSSTTAADSKCRECGCQEFRANVFKKGSCNNCFHVHVPL